MAVGDVRLCHYSGKGLQMKVSVFIHNAAAAMHGDPSLPGGRGCPPAAGPASCRPVPLPDATRDAPLPPEEAQLALPRLQGSSAQGDLCRAQVIFKYSRRLRLPAVASFPFVCFCLLQGGTAVVGAKEMEKKNLLLPVGKVQCIGMRRSFLLPCKCTSGDPSVQVETPTIRQYSDQYGCSPPDSHQSRCPRRP